MNNWDSYRLAILKTLRGRAATMFELDMIGGMNFRARISELRKQGWNIKCVKGDPNIYVLEGRYD